MVVCAIPRLRPLARSPIQLELEVLAFSHKLRSGTISSTQLKWVVVVVQHQSPAS